MKGPMADQPFTLDELDRGIVLGALMSLAACLQGHGHIWDEGEVACFEQAVVLMGGDKPEFTKRKPEDEPGEEWKKGGE